MQDITNMNGVGAKEVAAMLNHMYPPRNES